ncbi:MAG TPA: aminoglycoside phosphotransferase family protein [Streptosporangiaceae bacterium]
MPEFVLDHTQAWLDHFRRQGHDPRPLAAGVEGAIYELGDGLVAKVWRARRIAELDRMQAFYADVAAAKLSFSTPEILRIEQVDATAVTYERKLPGQALQDRLDLTVAEIRPAAAASVTEVLRALSTVTATGSMRELAALDEERPLWADAPDFRAALLDLIERRAARFGPVISDQLPDFDRRYAALRERLEALDTRPDTVIHGDLFGGNILVDEQDRPLAVLDFGFLTTAGDPRFDAAITAAIMNMYGPHALSITQDLTARLAEDLGYSTEVLLTYQAAYAAVTSNAFTPDGSDGHFEWCIAQLRRPDVSRALGL